MEDQDLEEKTDACEARAASPSIHEIHSVDSRDSADSYLYNNDDLSEENSYGGWGSDAYYNESHEDDSILESSNSILHTTQERSVDILGNASSAVETIEENLEENNNDPNNNMDLVELNGIRENARFLHDSASERARHRENPDDLHVYRPQSPKPGCSKDYQPPLAVSITTHILNLVSKINRDSVFDALFNDNKVSIKDLKLWDLIPEQERREFSKIYYGKEKFTEISAMEWKKASFPVSNNKMYMEWRGTSNGTKRGPADDICTVQPKKSSSDPDLSMNAPAALSLPLPRVSSASQIAHLPAPPINRGAIPKACGIRRPKTPTDALNALRYEAHQSLPMHEVPASGTFRPVTPLEENSKPETEPTINKIQAGRKAMTLEFKAASSSVPVKAPVLKHPVTRSTANRVNITDCNKSKPSSTSTPRPASAPITTVPMRESKEIKNRLQQTTTPVTSNDQQRPKVRGKRLPKPVPQRQPVSATAAPKPAAGMPPVYTENHRQMYLETGDLQTSAGNHERKQTLKPVTAAPIQQHKQTETGNRKNKPTPTSAPQSATVINQQKREETVIRSNQSAPTTAPLSAAPINQPRRLETAHRAYQPAPKAVALATASNYQQRPLETVNRSYQITLNADLVVAAAINQQKEAKKILQEYNAVHHKPQRAVTLAPARFHHQKQPETVNRAYQPAPLADATITQPRQTETVNRPTQPASTAAPLAAAPNYQQWPMDIGNLQGLPRPTPLTIRTPILLHEAPLPQPAPVKEQTTERVICEEMYYKLRNIFPNVDRKYIKKLCPPDWGPGNKDSQMAPIIEHLLEAGDTLPQQQPNDDSVNARNNFSYKSADDLYEFFIGIFPDADPHYLRDFSVKSLGKDEAIKNFVDLNLERRDYPTREQYMARLKITEQQKQYTTGFEVKQFLSIIPDPSKHFMDPQRKCTYQTVAFEFLKSHYNKLRVTTISKAYAQSRYNLSLTAHNLDKLAEELKSKRGGYEMPTEDILLLQEIAFVKHRGDINSYIARVKQTEKEEFKMLKARNQLLECQCCFDSECVPSKCSECDNGHTFCNSCIITGTSAKMGEDQTRIHCFMNCGSEFSLSVLQRVLAPTTFSILLKKRQAAEVMEAGLEGLVSCPFCHFASIPPEGDKIFKCLNPECTKESCRLCKELSHVPLKCEETEKNENARRYIEEKMTQALARKCYKCKRSFFKEEGCNKITCPCGAKMCYFCDQPIKDYTHFRGQGSDNKDLCPLYTDTIRSDAVAVRRVAEEAQQEMLKRNPNIKIDTTGLLPDIPLPRNGPHNDVLNADELPRRARRVLDLPPL